MTAKPDDRRVLAVVGLVHVLDGRLLVVRSRHKRAFYLPGGKIEPGESLEAAIRREVAEELGVGLTGLRQQKRYIAPAYGEGEGAIVDMTCFTGGFDGEPLPRAEIAEMAYVTAEEYAAHPETAPAIHEVLHDLVTSGLVSA